MRRIVLGMVAILAMVAMTGCISLSRSERDTIRELRSYGVRGPEETVKSPVAAGCLNILPGIGNFYLAAGTDEGDQWLYGFLNLITWPVSILWGIPEAAVDAGRINMRETVYYYTFDKKGKKEFERLKAENR